ncbi:DUF5995 family protein [Streptacidiphilus jiangxiensis]|uniref:Uncharacterized protein n=1 Tax=Streptacidiphilus jiangxiensis TaxID=235985 RepID=A0A1H7YDZ8_STRJI|nr:DUF5995 family protein [Streptacidiphilus jiangxiensis]SEM44452.1 hypothetical protein SAMN05414137_12852 [Streptacidiphilus jiangxiensis]
MELSTAPADAVAVVAARIGDAVGGLPPGDGVGVFGAVYLQVTDAMVRHLTVDGYFASPPDVARLDALFANRFLGALTAAAPPACWRPLLELRRHPGIRPIQFALAGMNSHIEHDLPLSVVETCRSLDCPPQALEADFHRVNDLLASVEDEVREELLTLPPELDVTDPLLHLLGSWSIEAARDAAWASARMLWELRDRPDAYAAAAATLDRTTGMTSRCLLTPLR